MAVEELPEPPPAVERFRALADRTLRDGWCMPSEALYPYREPLTLPQITTRRGGTRWPRWQLTTKVVKERARRWHVEASYPRGETERIGPLTSRRKAERVEVALIRLNQQVNELYWAEKETKADG